ncbi:MAG TPA: RlmE family RNA methyltransferase, partial [Acidisoma sp.]|nr:RlmE family RNA methyltransferase [Acidisoma sp.]
MAQDGRKGTADPGKGAGRGLTVKLKRTAGRSVASQRWLQRQLNDPYVAAAQKQGYRSRAAFKLIELDDRFHIIKKGMRVLDLGAAPGGWTQVALERGAALVVGIDLLEIPPIPGAHLIKGDATDPESQA